MCQASSKSLNKEDCLEAKGAALPLNQMRSLLPARPKGFLVTDWMVILNNE